MLEHNFVLRKFGAKVTEYLREMALADKPPSSVKYVFVKNSLGVHEHWKDPVEKKYSRNLGADEGIELICLQDFV